jgi:hypothetical protein
MAETIRLCKNTLYSSRDVQRNGDYMNNTSSHLVQLVRSHGLLARRTYITTRNLIDCLTLYVTAWVCAGEMIRLMACRLRPTVDRQRGHLNIVSRPKMTKWMCSFRLFERYMGDRRRDQRRETVRRANEGQGLC